MSGWTDACGATSIRSHRSFFIRSVEQLAQLDKALGSFYHDAADFDFEWAPSNLHIVAEHVGLVAEEDRTVIEQVLSRHAEIQMRFDQLPLAINYCDANDYNILVTEDAEHPRVKGFIDFGDMHQGPRLNDSAIALAYAISPDCPILIGGACDFIRGYNSIIKFTELELDLLLHLIKARLSISIIKAAQRREKDPNNTYWQISADTSRALLHTTP